jgi:hypothetical protein
MTHPTPDWTPETLLAYADGQLSDERARAVERLLETDPAAARCLADLRAGRDAADGGDILGAGEAMRKQGGGQMRSIGPIKAGGQRMAGMAGKGEAFGGHIGVSLAGC